MNRSLIKLHQQELEHIINPPINTIIEQLGGSQVKSHLLDGFMPGEQLYDNLEHMLGELKTVAITITYKQKYQMMENEDMRKILISTLAWIHNLHNIDIKTILVPDEDINGNYHYHGVIQIKRKDIRKFKKYITLFNGYMKLRYIEDTTKWQEYIMKSFTGQHVKCPEPIYNKEELQQLSIDFETI